MNQQTWTAVDDFLSGLIVQPDEVLTQALAASAAAGLPDIHVTAAQGKLLYLLARLVRAARILEIGTLGGYSTIWLARGLQSGGRLITLEYEPRHAAVAQQNIDRAGLADVVDIRVGRAIELLPQLEVEHLGPFDLIFIDADKASTADYFQWSLKLARPRSLILVDNVVRKGTVLDATNEDEAVRGIRRFLKVAANEPRVESTVLQTVSSKGYDGLALAWVREI